jgi:hypothetical protein
MRDYCKECGKEVPIFFILDWAELPSALERNEEIKVFHTSDHGIDHHWALSDTGKDNLRKRLA